MQQLDKYNTPSDNEAMAAFYALVDRLTENPPDGWNETDEILLCHPDIAGYMALKQEEEYEAQGWIYLRQMFWRWFGYKPDSIANNEPFRIKWEWLWKFERIKTAYNMFTSTISAGWNTIYDNAAMEQLGFILSKEKILNVTGNKDDFYFIDTPCERWEALYNTLFAVSGVINTAPLDGLAAALGGFTLRSLCDGDVKYNLKNEYWEINVKENAVFAHDTFNFDGPEFLGLWSCKAKNFVSYNIGDILDFITKYPDYYTIENSDFRDFQNKTGYGRNFIVLSDAHKVENFQGRYYGYPCLSEE